MSYLNRDERREVILQAAMRVALEEGFTAMTVRRIATEAQVSTGQVHHHFTSAGELKSLAFVQLIRTLLDAELVSAKSGGKITVEVNPGGKLGENLEMLTSLRAGKHDMSINFHGTLATVVPEVAAFSLPYAFSSPKAVWEILDGPVGQDLAGKIEQQGAPEALYDLPRTAFVARFLGQANMLDRKSVV